MAERRPPCWPWPRPGADRIHGGWQIETAFLRKIRSTGRLMGTSLEEIEDVLRSEPVRQVIEAALDRARAGSEVKS